MRQSRHRWFVAGIFFFFLLLHQSDQLLIGSLTPDIIRTFNISKGEMGLVSTGALIVGAIFYPIWGYLYDRYGRAKLLAVASFVWGATTWLNAIAPTFRAFLFTRASTGIDDSSYPGIFSLISDYFSPQVRGKIIGLLELARPLGYLVGMLLAIALAASIGWRSIFYITGTLGILLAIVIFLGVREPARGQTEPEMQGAVDLSKYRFNWPAARDIMRKPTLWLLFTQGFFGVFPWNVITFWFFTYLEEERGYTGTTLFLTMGIAVIVLAAGYPIGGALGDYFFKRSPRGRIAVMTTGVVVGAVLLLITMNVPAQNPRLFVLLLAATALFIPFSGPNVIATVFDVTLPEVRSTAQAIQLLIESAGAALAPLMAGLIADRSSLHDAILIICVSAWTLCAIFLALAGRVVSHDIADLRSQLRERARREQASQGEEHAKAFASYPGM